MRAQLFLAGSRLLLLFLALLAPAWSSAPSAAQPDQALGQIPAEAIRAHMRFLADDLLEGRGTGTRGYQLAANYMAAQFEAMGLEPAGSDGSFFQPVPLRKTELVESGSSLALLRGGKEVKLAYGKDYVLRGNHARTEASVAAPVVFAGFGVTAPELRYDDYAGVDVRGKIVALFPGAPASFPHNQRAYYSSSTVKRTNAVARGAVGFLLLRRPEDEERFPWERLLRAARMPGMRWLDESGIPQNISPEIRGQAVLSRSGAEALFSGAPKSLEEALAAASEGQPQAFDLPVEARLHTVSRHSRLESPNVAALLAGSDARLRGEYVVYTAHLDHLGVGEPVKGDAIHNGAYDNASGSAALIEIARAFTRLPEPPRRSVLFLAVTGEERGLLGSDYFVHHPTVPLEKMVANVNLDMYLMLHPLRDIVAFGAEHSSLGHIVEQAAAELGLAVSPDPVPEEVVFIRSDQYSFVRQGVPAVFLKEGDETGDASVDGAELSREWRRTRYHTPQDDLNQPMDFEAGARFAQVNLLIGYRVANQTHRPAWHPGDFFGQKFGRAAITTAP